MNCLSCGKRSYSDYCVAHKLRKRIAVKPAFCTNCDRVGHVRMQCSRRIHRSYQHGTYYRKWIATRKRWLKENPKDSYNCHYCNMRLDSSTLTLDHKVPRSKAPGVRYEFSNLVPSCGQCNYLKGSVSHDDYAHTCHN